MQVPGHLNQGSMRYVPSSEEYFLIKPKVDMSWEELIRKMTLVGEPFLTVYRDIAGNACVWGLCI